MSHRQHIFFTLCLVVVLMISGPTFARSVPTLTGPVVDEANLLTTSQSDQISNALFQFKQQTQKQVQLLIVDSLQGDSLEDFSIRVVDAWKLGNTQRDDGVLFLIAVKDRLMRIEVGQGFEGDLTDAASGRIINDVRAYFRQQDYFGGIVAGLNSITTRLGGSPSNLAPTAPTERKISFDARSIMLILFFPAFIFMNIFSALRRRSTSVWTGGGISSGHASSSGFGGGGSSWGGGGGGFSGGGASGGW